MKQFFHQMEEQLTTVPTICAAVEEAWRSISSEEIQDIVDTMPARLQAVFAAHGVHTR